MSKDTKRPGMVLYFEDYHTLATLNDRDFRLVLDALVKYSETGEHTELKKSLLPIYQLLASKVGRDKDRYERTVEARRAAGRKGGNAKAARANQPTEEPDEPENVANVANASKGWQNKQTKTKTQTETKTKTESLSPNPSQAATPEAGSGEERPGDGEREIPTVQEIVDYGKEAGYERVDEETARSFIGQQAARGWMDSSGNEIRDWKSWFSGWYTRNVISSIRPANKPTSMQYDQRVYSDDDLNAIENDWLESEDGA